MVKKTVDVEAKASLQSPSKTREIDSRCPKDHRPAKKTKLINAIKVAKIDKNKAKDLSHIECYTRKQKGHYANKCLEKPKN